MLPRAVAIGHKDVEDGHAADWSGRGDGQIGQVPLAACAPPGQASARPAQPGRDHRPFLSPGSTTCNRAVKAPGSSCGQAQLITASGPAAVRSLGHLHDVPVTESGRGHERATIEIEQSQPVARRCLHPTRSRRRVRPGRRRR